jgi:hypothetical protein
MAKSGALKGLEVAHENLFYNSTGVQAESVKPSEPQWSLPKASRDTEKKVYISKKHYQDSLGRDSPGPVYIPKRQRSLPSWGFGTSDARPPPALGKYPESSNNLIGTIPDGQVFKYKSITASIGVCPRFGAGCNQPDYCGFEPGKISPGPQRYSPSKDSCYSHRMSWAPGADNIPPKYTMRKKTTIKELESQTPAKVGPGIYPVPEACMPQPRSEKPSKPRWSFSKEDRFPQPLVHGEAGRLWDGDGQRKIQFNRAYSSPASYSFGTSTRDHRKRVSPVITKGDGGPADDMGKILHAHPTLPTRKDVIKYTDCPAGKN